MDFLINARFQNFDHFATKVRAWELDFVQLERGEPEFELMMASVGGVQVARAKMNKKIYQQGMTPKGGRTFVIPMNPSMDFQWYGYQVTGNDLMVFPDTGELSSLTFPNFDVLTFSVKFNLLDSLLEDLELIGFYKYIDSNPVIRLAPRMMARLRNYAAAVLAPLERNDGDLCRDASFHQELRLGLSAEIVKTITSRSGVSGGVGKVRESKRKACVQAVIQHLVESPEAPTVSELCKMTNVSERTFQYAFREQFGITPKRFISAWQLNKVRRELSQSTLSEQASIARLAGRYGFWHMGQFAADYRKMFGELPSTTLQRCG